MARPGTFHSSIASATRSSSAGMKGEMVSLCATDCDDIEKALYWRSVVPPEGARQCSPLTFHAPRRHGVTKRDARALASWLRIRNGRDIVAAPFRFWAMFRNACFGDRLNR